MEKIQYYPTVVKSFNEVPVVFHEINGQKYMTGENLGLCLEYEFPRKAVNNIFDRHRDELEPHTCVLKMMSEGDNQNRAIRLYNKTGCNLVSMFSQTPKGKEFRLWLAKLPKKHREITDKLINIHRLSIGSVAN